jgi:hypothetical protein
MLGTHWCGGIVLDGEDKDMSSLPTSFDSIDDYDSYAIGIDISGAKNVGGKRNPYCDNNCDSYTSDLGRKACCDKKAQAGCPCTRCGSLTGAAKEACEGGGIKKPAPYRVGGPGGSIGIGGQIHDTRPNAPAQSSIPLFSPGVTASPNYTPPYPSPPISEQSNDGGGDGGGDGGETTPTGGGPCNASNPSTWVTCIQEAFRDPKAHMMTLAAVGLVAYMLIKKR